MSEINTANVGKETQVGAFLVRGGALDVDYCYDDEKKELEILTEIPLIISNKRPEKETGTDIIMNRNQEYHITLENVNLTDETHRGGVRIWKSSHYLTRHQFYSWWHQSYKCRVGTAGNYEGKRRLYARMWNWWYL